MPRSPKLGCEDGQVNKSLWHLQINWLIEPIYTTQKPATLANSVLVPIPEHCPLPHLACFVDLYSSGRQAARLFSVPHVVQQETTLAYLENQVAAALTLQSSHEYRHWLLLYARYLVNEGEVLVTQVAFSFCSSVF